MSNASEISMQFFYISRASFAKSHPGLVKIAIQSYLPANFKFTLAHASQNFKIDQSQAQYNFRAYT